MSHKGCFVLFGFSVPMFYIVKRRLKIKHRPARIRMLHHFYPPHYPFFASGEAFAS
jgi:hypothetical protein